MNKIIKYLIYTISFISIIIGIFIFFNDPIREKLMEKQSEKYSLKEISPNDIKKNEQEEVSFDFSSIEPVSTGNIIKAQTDNNKKPVVGSIIIPDVNINLPIFKGLDNNQLYAGAGTMKADQKMGERNYALASHNMEDSYLLFSPLDRVQTGSKIYTTDLINIYEYEIDVVKRIKPNRIDVINDVEGKDMITLITCGDLYAKSRILVQGNLSDVIEMDKADDDLLNALNVPRRTAY